MDFTALPLNFLLVLKVWEQLYGEIAVLTWIIRDSKEERVMGMLCWRPGTFAYQAEKQTFFPRQGHFRKDSVPLPFPAFPFISGSLRMLAEMFTLIHRAIALQISLISLS